MGAFRFEGSGLGVSGLGSKPQLLGVSWLTVSWLADLGFKGLGRADSL